MSEDNKKMTLTLEFSNDTNGQEEVRRVLSVNDCYSALWDIGQEIFRPARKHGYLDKEIADALEKAGEAGPELVHLLEKKFYEILTNHGITTED